MDEPPQDTILLTALSPDERTRALQRYQILQPFLEHGLSLSQLAHHHDIPRRTLYDWLAQYQRHGLAGLTRRSRRDRGHHRGLRPELKELIEGLALRKRKYSANPSPPSEKQALSSQSCYKVVHGKHPTPGEVDLRACPRARG
jgi:transposase-like protein